MSDSRQRLLDAVSADLIGPANGPEEILENARPSDRYLTGILYPILEEDQGKELTQEDDDDRGAANADDDGPDEPVPMDAIRRPSSMGLSFRYRGDRIRIEGTAGRYRRRWRDGTAITTEDKGRENEIWVREPIRIEMEVALDEGLREQRTSIEGLRFWIRCLRAGPVCNATVILENDLRPVPGRVAMEESMFLQAFFEVMPLGEGTFEARRPARNAIDVEGRTNELIYRDVREWAIGHVCSATWSSTGSSVATTWMPWERIRSMSTAGHPLFADEARKMDEPDSVLNAARLADLGSGRLVDALSTIPRAYRRWCAELGGSLARGSDLTPSELETGREHLDTITATASRIEGGIVLLRSDPIARRAFQLAQQAMVLQRRWTSRDLRATLTWRPFQLAFQLLALPGLTSPSLDDGSPTAERLTMDLLWFPTGGGKTEAYLGLIAFLLFHRRLRTPSNPDQGAGVAAIMRYTLRLLTVQQFERAARMVLACEHLRRTASAAGDQTLGDVPFSVGLWVGNEATPGKVSDARTTGGRLSARQLTRCPACQEASLDWDPDPDGPYVIVCRTLSCPFTGSHLPLYTIDELIYRERPSLLLGTVDKFAQIVRNPLTHAILGGDEPPDLIIQDELHLISGPLGTIVGVYEAAIDIICSRARIPPKVIGSTATIRRADDQVLRLFDRRVSQFPPPGLSWTDSCFAIVDEDVPGRVYVGISSAGRSPKFTLQAVCAALMQRASEPILRDDERDPYWTLLGYFNSIRELGGAHVMMLDDVNDSMRVYAASHGTQQRARIEEPLELSSHVPSTEIPDVLARLERPYPDQDIAAVLATNMVSVGVDIPRLGLMVVNGQPKSMAEYIQASSRVGREKVPGLIFTVYNAGRVRDRAHYESFRTWHQALYRDVEATSVTPFAPRARDRALHAAIVAIARHLVPTMLEDPELTPTRRTNLEDILRRLHRRIESVEPQEADETAAQARRFLDQWEGRGRLEHYWNDYRTNSSLLISAEAAATRVATRGAWVGSATPTLNSMREVEPSTQFRVTERLFDDARVAGGNDGST